ncbi:conserved hypothetical protein [Planktothrix sp. PCC 11201]|uniref:hypothetical protein n=1 Tax=Planktothrix sp. PCC 11201 TaxID=1729650 RepID=UPI000913DA99|nr:hypothetical protein [Planktothrix sp. PCC 11201]SKB14345.1 conserved hypothetical protein [Planktothrix sp. PCC 11201]
MLAHRIEATITDNKTLTLENLPFDSGEEVEIIILSRQGKGSEQKKYALRGTTVEYLEPMKPVAQEDWEVIQ